MNFDRAQSDTDESDLSADPGPAFAGFVANNERSLRRSLTAALGAELAPDATAEALAYGWENWERLSGMENAAGYLYRVGLNWGRKLAGRRRVMFPPPAVEQMDWFEPGLPDALASLSGPRRDRPFRGSLLDPGPSGP